LRAAELHPWRVSYAQAVAIQERLRAQVRIQPQARPVRLVAGADVAYSRVTHRMYAAVVVTSLPELTRVETVGAFHRARFPYIPGLFSFRELPPLLLAFARLRHRPDVLFFDGQGLAHPRRFGLACHGGLLLRRPALGCAKSLLVGAHGPLGFERGATADLVHEGEVVGAALRTQQGVGPVYVSVGHRMDLPSALRLVLAATGRYRIPEPLRLAHQATETLRRRLDAGVRPPRRRDYPDFVGGRGPALPLGPDRVRA
jgi:deoxyribonuclease V